LKLLALSNAVTASTSYTDVLVEQLLNSAIVGGIAAVATWTGTTPDLLVAAKAFALTFLVELRKYRGVGLAETSSTPAPPQKNGDG